MTKQQVAADMGEARESSEVDAPESWVSRTHQEGSQPLTFEAYASALAATHNRHRDNVRLGFGEPSDKIQFIFNPKNRSVHSMKPTIIRTFDEAATAIDGEIAKYSSILREDSTLYDSDKRNYQSYIEVLETFKIQLEKQRQAQLTRGA